MQCTANDKLAINQRSRNSVLKRILLIALLFGATPALAGPPTNEEILTARTQAAEAQVNYLAKVLERIQFEGGATTDYWKSYVAGLKPEEK